MVERIIKFLQAYTQQQVRRGGKVKANLVSEGGHDSDCVVKAIFDKPEAMTDLIQATAYGLLQGNLDHRAKYSVPFSEIERAGFYCVDCERAGRFCGLTGSEKDVVNPS